MLSLKINFFSPLCKADKLLFGVQQQSLTHSLTQLTTSYWYIVSTERYIVYLKETFASSILILFSWWSILSFMCNVVDGCLFLCPFSLGHCVVCRSIYGFWLPLWYLQALLICIALFERKEIQRDNLGKRQVYMYIVWKLAINAIYIHCC
jgi:hypothetical protein